MGMQYEQTEYVGDVQILNRKPFEAIPMTLDFSSVGTKLANGKKVVKAGTPFPSNDNKCVGYLLHDVDTTQGDAAGTYVFAGSLDESVIKANGINVTAEAKAATPRVTFFKK